MGSLKKSLEPIWGEGLGFEKQISGDSEGVVKILVTQIIMYPVPPTHLILNKSSLRLIHFVLTKMFSNL